MKKISAEQLYEAMEGIGDDLLLRSEQSAAGKTGRRRMRTRTIRRISVAVTALAAVMILGFLGLNTLRMGSSGGESAAPAAATVETADQAYNEIGLAGEANVATESASEAAAAAAADEADAGAGMRQPLAAQSSEASAFFVLDGIRYTETERIENDQTVAGEPIATITTEINEWSDASAYVSGAGSVLGPVYLVNGREREEALCMIEENTGTVLIFEAEDR